MSNLPSEPQGPGAPLSELADQLRKAGIDTSALERGLAAANVAVRRATQPPTRAPLAATSSAISAATRGCFLPSDLTLDAASTPVLAAEIDSLLAHSDVMTTGSQRAWQLRLDARRDILQQASKAGSLLPMIEKLAQALDVRDGEGPLLRQVLAGRTPNVASLSIGELGHLQTVSEWLGGTQLANLPPPEELRRAIAQREILDPFRALVGRTVEAGSDGSQDRVVGRVVEMERLRAYVGVREPEELKYYATRALTSLWSAVTFSNDASQPLLIRGIGGMGKSTLIAKFVLDHALFPKVDLPFVYLDFDRAALAPRQPLQLLIEMATQLGIQFPDMEPGLKDLRKSLRSSIDVQARNADNRERERRTRSEVASFCKSLQSTVEAVNRSRAPIVVLFDTFEVVQYDQQAVDGVNALIAALRQPDKESWSNLRIVVAGRGDLSDVKTTYDPVDLLQLTLDATEELLRRRSESEKLGLTDAHIKALAPALRNSPLDVIVVTNWLRDRKPEERPCLAEDLVKDIDPATGRPSGGHDNQGRSRELASRRITSILIRRMIGHINDREVRDLADPGLVVRAVTPLIIREVMAPASGLSSDAKPLPEGAETELWNRLARERWLVNQEGSVLRHRTEVRRAMLDLMREQDKDDFARTNALALASFRKRPSGDDVARAEVVYHLLLGGEAPLEEADALWSPFIGSMLASAVDDLDTRGSGYVEAKLGRSVPLDTLQSFPHAVLLPLVVANGPRYLQDHGPASFLRLLDSAQGVRENPACTGLFCEALYRAGRWNGLRDVATADIRVGRVGEAVELLWRGDSERLAGFDEPTLTALRFLLRWATRDATADDIFAERVDRFAHTVFDPSRLLQLLQVPALCGDFATLVVCGGTRTARFTKDLREAVLNSIGDLCRKQTRLPDAAEGSDALRVLSFFEQGPERPILRHVDFVNHFATVSGREIQAFQRLIAGGFDRSDDDESRLATYKSQYEDAVRRGMALMKTLSGFSERMVRADVAFKREFAWVVRSIAESGGERSSRAVLQTLSLKHTDWLQPLGNALTEAFDGDVPRKLGWWSSIDKYLGSGEQPRSERETVDGQEILSLADEASSLADAIAAYERLLQGSNTNPNAERFLALRQAFYAWVELIENALAEPATKDRGRKKLK